MAIEDDAELRFQRRQELACELVAVLPWGEQYIYEHDVYCPGRLVPLARRAIRGLDAMPAPVAADHLAECGRHLLQLAEEAMYPRWAEGYGRAEYFREEREEIVGAQHDDRVLALAPRTLHRRIRRAVNALGEPVSALEADFDVVSRNGYRRTVDPDKAGAVQELAGGTAVLCALLAVDLDPAVVSRVWARRRCDSAS